MSSLAYAAAHPLLLLPIHSRTVIECINKRQRGSGGVEGASRLPECVRLAMLWLIYAIELLCPERSADPAAAAAEA